jgi:hypothetical protein
LAVQIDDEFVKTAIWTVKDESTSLVAVGSTQDWDGSSTEILIEAVDASLTVALGKLPPENPAEPNQVIFGLPETWVGSDGISPARLKDLKSICEKLELDPVGFVVTTEAITHYLKSKEGTPLSAILARISATEITVSIIRLGNIEGTHVVGRSGDLASDVREGLTRFGDQESLPARMVIYDGGGEDSMEDLTQQLMAFDWQSCLPFLHMPHIESVSEVFSITAIAVAGGSEVAKSLGITINRVLIESDFQPEIDTLTTAKQQAKPENDKPALATPSSQSKTRKFDSSTKSLLTSAKSAAAWLTAQFKLVKLFLMNLLEGLSNLKLNKTVFIVAIILVLAIFAGNTALQRFSRANIKITFASQTLNQKIKVTADPAASQIIPDSAVLPAVKINLTKSVQQSINTSGKITTGEKAKGEVTIYNRRTDGSKIFSTGTVIASDNREFLLDREIEVASASADNDYTIIPGKAKISVTASKFGSDFNLPATTEFQVGDFSKSIYVAKNDTAFTGGTKREIRAVSKEDLENLKQLAIAELKSQAAAEIKTQEADKHIFLETLMLQIETEKLSAETGDEAESVNLELKGEITALAAEKQHLINLLLAILQGTIPEGFSIAPDNLKISIENVEYKDQTAIFDVLAAARLSPIVNRTEVIKRILGKRPAAALSEIKTLPYFMRADMEISPKLPDILRWLPSDENRINLEVKLEEN